MFLTLFRFDFILKYTNSQLFGSDFLKKYENKIKVVGNLIKDYRLKKKLSKSEVSRLLQLHAVYIDRIQLYRMESGQMIIKDFELLAICKVLDIPFKELENIIE